MLPAARPADVVNTKTIKYLLPLVVAGLSSCIGQHPSESSQDTSLSSTVHFDFGQPMGMTRAEYADFLTQKAAELADAELARLSAIELMYRDKTYFHSYRMSQGNIFGAAYAKIYRQFTDSRLVDITRSESILHPLVLTIDFDYDILASELILSNIKDRQKAFAAHNLKTYTVSRSATTRRVYICDEKARPLDPLPPPLPRPNVWDEGHGGHLMSFSLEEAVVTPAGVEARVQRSP